MYIYIYNICIYIYIGIQYAWSNYSILGFLLELGVIMYMHCSYLFYWQLGVVNGGL